MAAVAPALGEGLRRALLIGEARDPEVPDAPGLVVLGDDLEIESFTPGTERWFKQLPGRSGDTLPISVGLVARAALRPQSTETAFAGVVGADGTWIVLHGAPLADAGRGQRGQRVAVIIEPAHPAKITPLLMSAYGLTEREQEITAMVLRGASSNAIAQELFISPQTRTGAPQEQFAKTEVRSRRDLVGKVFFAHYEPRLRDNERRALEEQPLRGGPVA